MKVWLALQMKDLLGVQSGSFGVDVTRVNKHQANKLQMEGRKHTSPVFSDVSVAGLCLGSAGHGFLGSVSLRGSSWSGGCWYDAIEDPILDSGLEAVKLIYEAGAGNAKCYMLLESEGVLGKLFWHYQRALMLLLQGSLRTKQTDTNWKGESFLVLFFGVAYCIQLLAVG
ncbi:hypothetical protein VNO80_27004 [Phaseolus coccineus]|uniref:Uncharacterized protein n=1 Tax=Phaseolus coccineus TaxID=3886 RepID=A0AAN9LJ26_PHACN